MKRYFFLASLFAAIVLFGFSFAGCTEDPVEPQAKIGKPTNVILQKLTANSFSVTWTRAQNDNGANTVTIIRTAPTTAQWQLSVASPLSVLTVQDTSITNTGGSFTVTVASKDSTSDPATITIVAGNTPAPTGVQVTSLANTSFGVRWTRGTGDVGVNKIIATPLTGGAEVTVAVSSSAVSGNISVATPGKYNIQVESSTGSRSAAVEWATAIRSGVLTVYETYANVNAGLHAGLILGPTARTASTTGSVKDQIDLVLVTENSFVTPPYLSFQGADVAGSGIPFGKVTKLGDAYFIVNGGLDFDFYTSSFANEFTSGVNYVEIPGTVSPPVILLVKTADNHFARVEIVPQSNGLLWKDVVVSGTSYRAIDVVVSYQPLTGVGYASRPTDIRRGSNTSKAGGARRVVK